MKNNIQSCFSFNFKSILIDEIGLNGLEGISLDFLWKRMGSRLSCTLTPKIICKFWNFLSSSQSVSFYSLDTPVPKIDVLDRFTLVDEESGQLLDPPTAIDGPYEFCPIEGEYGSSANYKTRSLIPFELISTKTYEEVVETYGDTLVIVASIEVRWQALAPHLPICLLSLLSPVHYCILELVGKGRGNGQMTIGNTNLTKIVKESKLLFYNRKTLQNLDLIRVQCVTQVMGDRGMKSLLLRLKRFHEPFVKSQPKIGKIRTLFEYLRKQPNYSERNEKMIRMGYLTPHQSKRLQKTINIFKFEEKDEKKKKHITLISPSDESSHSEDETPATPLKCQYKVGVSLLRQAYERFVDAGLKGLTQIEVAQLLGIEFYTSRIICRIFKSKGLVSEFLEDKGRQRTARYIAVAATNEINNIYAEEKQKLLDHVTKNRKRCKSVESETLVKRRKQESNEDDKNDDDDLEKFITEIRVLDGFEDRTKESLINNKKKPTLRQLKFASGILKVVNERGFVTGYQTLSSFVSLDTGEPPMDTKSLKLVLQKLITDDQIKIYKLRISCPDKDRFSLCICPPYVKPNDSLLKDHYAELSYKAQMKYKSPHKKTSKFITRPLTKFAYPRYMKIQKLHEQIVQLVYFSEHKTNFIPGFTSLNELVPEMTVEFALGNILFDSERLTCSNLKYSDEVLEVKLKDAPDNIRYPILNSKSLHNSIKLSLKLLAVLGLIQLIRDPTSCAMDEAVYLNFVFYVNQRAKILDTSGIWPRPSESHAALEKTFYFKSMNDVMKYWDEVQAIGLNTTISGIKRERYKFLQPLRNGNEVLENDDGSRFGDGLGPCGFDSSIFIDMPRFWRTFTARYSKPIVVKVLKSSMKYIKGSKSGAKLKRDEAKPVKKRKGNPRPKPIVKAKPLRQKRLTRRRESAVKWSKLDDQILNMLKITVAVMGPVPGSIKVRNSVAKNLLSVLDPGKLASLCHRRATFLENNPELAHEKMCILNELRRHTDLIEKYEGLLKVLRVRHYANLPKFVTEAKVPMLELLWIINQIAKTKPLIQQTPCVARDLDEFHDKYIVSSSTHMKVYSLYRTASESQPEMAMLKEGIVMTVMLTLDGEVSEETSRTIYSVFKMHQEYNLRGAIEELRKSGAISAREKILNNRLHKVHFNDITQSSYKISFSYRRRWINQLRSRFSENLAEFMIKELPQTGLKGSSVINCLLFEMHSCETLEIVSVAVPVIVGSAGSLIQEEKMNIIDTEGKYKLKSGLVGWKSLTNLRTFSELFKDCDFKEPLASLTSFATFDETKDIDTDDEIIQYLDEKQKSGGTFAELKDLTGLDGNSLYEKLKKLEEEGTILLVGYFDNRAVLKKYAKPWFFQIGDTKFITPEPWLTLNNELQYNVFTNWASVIMSKVFDCPGCSFDYLSSSFEFITTRSVQDICEFLEKIQCVELKCMETCEVDLFSDDTEPELIDYNPYQAPTEIVVFPKRNSLTKFSYIKHRLLKGNEGRT
ncbi:uncharacterized protein LOC123716159 isoform X2 [Pieris brassicae]|uniref:uncharacterized protein LOC123716159 isoform X2 n=1 Tax=Pieris brassicae TaxID=7116 RepID=UPI001E65E420|nr:uncharacterized protein LOC123716159 isoform X2 [Pieris brassicae]